MMRRPQAATQTADALRMPSRSARTPNHSRSRSSPCRQSLIGRHSSRRESCTGARPAGLGCLAGFPYVSQLCADRLKQG
jgi:hypothetical protein